MTAGVLVYALGGGWGHLVRGLAFGRAAARRGHRVTLLVNSPQVGRVDAARELGSQGCLQVLPSEWPAATQRAAVREALSQRPWSALVVDTFPRGLGGELADVLDTMDAPKLWVHRDLTPRYVERFGLRELARRAYDLVLVPGEPAPLDDLPHAVRTAPWLIRDPHERLPRDAARRRIVGEAGPARPLVLVSPSGTPEEAQVFARRAERLRRALRDHAHVVLADRLPWPLLEALPGADLLIGAGGYHTVHEARACGVPLLAIPQRRLYDRQARRLAPDELACDDTLVERARAALARRPCAPPPAAASGVHAAVDALEGLQSLRQPATFAGGAAWR